MTPETPHLLAYRLDAILDRLQTLEVQVRGLLHNQTVEAQAREERGRIRARFEMHEYAPCLTFYDRLGKERLRIGLRTDGTPAMWVEGRDIPSVISENRG